MRRQRFGSSRIDELCDPESKDRTRALLRRAQWSAYYHRFYGRIRPGDQVPLGFAPMNLDDTVAVLYDALRDRTANPKHWPLRRDTVRRCVSLMVLYGHRPSSARQRRYNAVVKVAAAPEVRARPSDSVERAEDFLIGWGSREFLPIDPTQVVQMPIAQRLAQTPKEKRLVALPTRITNTPTGFVFDKQVYLRTRLGAVAALVNPENWSRLGQFFVLTCKESASSNPRVKAPPKPWRGVLREHFIVSWNNVRTSIFKQRLKVDYSVTRDLVRTDYTLMYEEDDQIVANDGFMQIKRDPSLPGGWISGSMQKKLKFTSSVQNLFCPALLSMMVDGTVGGFNNFVRPRNANAAQFGLFGGPVGAQLQDFPTEEES